MCQYTIVKQEALVKRLHQIPFNSASIIGCGVMTGFGSAVNAAQVLPGSSCAVIGCGGVGLNVIQGCKIAGAEKIIAIDINEGRLKRSANFGANVFILAGKDEENLNKTREKVLEETDGRGADYAFECTAVPELGAAPLNLVRNAGIAVQVSESFCEVSYCGYHISHNGEKSFCETKVWEPIFSRNKSGNITSLGLAVCREILQMYDGDIFLNTDTEEHTTFTVILPVK